MWTAGASLLSGYARVACDKCGLRHRCHLHKAFAWLKDPPALSEATVGLRQWARLPWTRTHERSHWNGRGVPARSGDCVRVMLSRHELSRFLQVFRQGHVFQIALIPLWHTFGRSNRESRGVCGARDKIQNSVRDCYPNSQSKKVCVLPEA